MSFKIGDRVNSRGKGDGTVIALDGENIGVEYDKYFDGHSCSSARNGRSGKNGYCWWELEEDIEKIGGNKMTKKDLKNGDIVTLRNGDKLVLCDKRFSDLTGDYSNHLCDLDELKDDLTYKAWDGDSSNDIVKVERPVKYETVFEREEAKELTVDEISEKLGYKVKVVGLK